MKEQDELDFYLCYKQLIYDCNEILCTTHDNGSLMFWFDRALEEKMHALLNPAKSATGCCSHDLQTFFLHTIPLILHQSRLKYMHLALTSTIKEDTKHSYQKIYAL